MAENEGGLIQALAKVQAELPHIKKDQKADVQTKTGRDYSYTYADLAQISASVLPLLGKNGLAWTTRPTLTGEGRFVLAYKLAHESGESEVGEYPLPDPTRSTPQEVGSAITYARRYTLCSVVGVAPEDDDDDAAAASTVRPPAQRQQRTSGGERQQERKPKDDGPPQMPTAPIGWRKLAERQQVGMDVLRDAFAHDEAIAVALNDERWHIAVSALTAEQKAEVFEFMVTPDPEAGHYEVPDTGTQDSAEGG